MGISQQIGASSLIKAGVIENTANRPASPYEGQVIFQKDTDQLLVWNGTAWVIPNSPAQNPTGLELVKNLDFSGVQSVDVSSCFSSSYINYHVIIQIAGNAVGALYLRTLTGTTAIQTDPIYSIQSGFRYSSGTGSVTASTRGDQYCLFGAMSANQSSYLMNVYSPNLSIPTNITMNGVFQWTPTDHDLVNVAARNAVTTALTGFQLTSAGGPVINGNVKVYGYRNS